MNNKKVIIGLFMLGIIVSVVGYFVLFGRQEEKEIVDQPVYTESVPTIAPEDLGLNIEVGSKTCLVKSANNQVRLKVENTNDIKRLEWIISYDADIPLSERVEGSAEKVSQSFENEADIKEGESFVSEYGLLGTCSKNVCRCDSGVESVKLLVKITKTDGKVYQSELIKEL